ncbi:MAG: hypothetical protein ACR2QJ_00845 [Geminicoccaceae bacterium]
MKRRGFLAIAAALAVGSSGESSAIGATSRPAAPSVESMDEAALLADHLLQAYPERRSLAAIGDAFWKDSAGSSAIEISLEGVMRDLLTRIDQSDRALYRMSASDLRACIKSTTVKDFESGKIVRVGGWLLGETEIRICAIAALRQA